MKKGLIFSGIALLVLTAFGKHQIEKVQDIANKLKFKLHKINGFKFEAGFIKINLDLKLVNNSTSTFNVSSGQYINLKKVEFFTDKGHKLGKAFKQINNINLQANSYTIIENIDVEVQTEDLNPIVLNFIINTPEKIITKAYINFLGSEIVL